MANFVKKLRGKWQNYRYRFVPWIAVNLKKRTVRSVQDANHDKILGDDAILSTYIKLFSALEFRVSSSNGGPTNGERERTRAKYDMQCGRTSNEGPTLQNFGSLQSHVALSTPSSGCFHKSKSLLDLLHSWKLKTWLYIEDACSSTNCSLSVDNFCLSKSTFQDTNYNGNACASRYHHYHHLHQHLPCHQHHHHHQCYHQHDHHQDHQLSASFQNHHWNSNSSLASSWRNVSNISKPTGSQFTGKGDDVSDLGATVMHQVLGYAVGRLPSQIEGGGTGVYVTKGMVPKGSVVAMYPGTIYYPAEPILLQSINNPFVFRCLDGIHIDGNGKNLSKMIYRSCAQRDRLGPYMLCDLSWLTSSPVNPMAVGQYVNNQHKEVAANVCYQECDVPFDFPVKLRKYIPNTFYSTIPDTGNAERSIRTVALVALRDIQCGEELLSTYFTLVY